MLLSVIIPCRNEVNYIEECIEAIYQNNLDSGIEINTIVVDGMSNDGTRALLEQLKLNYSNLHLVDNINQLTPYAFNLGIHFKQADFYQIVGARQILSNNYLQDAINILKKDATIWCVGGTVENVYINYKSEMIAQAMSTSFGMGLGNFRTLSKSEFTDTVGTPMYPSKVFKEIGYFDEDLIRNQDDDFNFRVTQAGGKIWFESKISLKYYVRGNFEGLFRQFFQYGYWKVFVNKKHKAVTTFRQLIPPLFVLFTICYPFISLLPFFHFIGNIGFSIYFILGVLFAIKKSNSITDTVFIFITFPILHYSYGLGYLLGIFHFIFLNKKPSQKQTRLSR